MCPKRLLSDRFRSPSRTRFQGRSRLDFASQLDCGCLVRQNTFTPYDYTTLSKNSSVFALNSNINCAERMSANEPSGHTKCPIQMTSIVTLYSTWGSVYIYTPRRGIGDHCSWYFEAVQWDTVSRLSEYTPMCIWRHLILLYLTVR